MPAMLCDLLVFAPHPDDAEIHFGATIARCVRHGQRVTVIDASRGEMGSRGSAAERDAEAEAAAAALGLCQRRNLGLPDGHIDDHDRQARLAVVDAIRDLRPRLVACSHPHSQHPDHRAFARLVLDTFKACELHRLPGTNRPAWRQARLCCYEAELPVRPDLLVGSEEEDWQRKEAAIRCYCSQLHGGDNAGPETSIAQPDFLRWIESRGRTWGHQIRRPYAEALTAALGPLSADDCLLMTTAGGSA